MKSFIAAFALVISFSSFGGDGTVLPGSVDSFLSVLPLGSYVGLDDVTNEACAVVVTEVNFPAKAISVTATKKDNKIFKVISDGSEFSFKPHRKEFVQADRHYVDSTRTSFVDRVVRTITAGENLLYVVVANEVTVNREVTVEEVECVVRL